MKKLLKAIVPKTLWEFVRRMLFRVPAAFEHLGPYERHMRYRGFKLHYARGDSIVKRLRREPVFEEKMCQDIVHELNKSQSPVFLDIGANIGLISLYVAAAAPAAKIYAFEPGPVQAGMLEKTIESNKLTSRIELTIAALSDSAGRRKFHIHPAHDMSKDGLRDTGRGEKAMVAEVDTLTLDDWWEKTGSPRINVVKIDTEGAELLILRGARFFLAKARPVVYLEIERSNLKAYPYSAGDILSFLGDMGYSLSSLQGERADAENLNDLLRTGDTFRAAPLP
ncbi:MAG: hypothetical protein QOG91_158 [Candidatus Parcubacteria bacterium]|jgi:FkbM family methyltransferase|nr:hypothetical protein [Candidatus Parcubacteria bacterium]